MSATCATCVHWQAYDEMSEWDAGDVRERVEDGQVRRWGHCKLIDMADTFDKIGDEEVLAYVMDGSQYRADLYTRADFGCVQHAERPVVIDL